MAAPRDRRASRAAAVARIIVAENMREVRREKAWTMLDVAASLDITQSQLSRREAGHAAVTVDQLAHMAAIYGVKFDRMVAGLVGDR